MYSIPSGWPNGSRCACQARRGAWFRDRFRSLGARQARRRTKCCSGSLSTDPVTKRGVSWLSMLTDRETLFTRHANIRGLPCVGSRRQQKDAWAPVVSTSRDVSACCSTMSSNIQLLPPEQYSGPRPPCWSKHFVESKSSSSHGISLGLSNQKQTRQRCSSHETTSRSE